MFKKNIERKTVTKDTHYYNDKLATNFIALEKDLKQQKMPIKFILLTKTGLKALLIGFIIGYLGTIISDKLANSFHETITASCIIAVYISYFKYISLTYYDMYQKAELFVWLEDKIDTYKSKYKRGY